MTFKQNWEKTDQHYGISPQTIEKMVALAFPQSHLASHEVISGGCANLNIKITLESKDQPYILRLYLRDKDAAYREQELGRRLKGVVPLPQTYFVGDLGEHRFAITEFMPGITLRDLLLGGEPCDMGWLMRETGEILANIQAIRFSGPGFFHKDLTVYDPLTQAGYTTFVRKCLTHPTVIDKLGKMAISKISQLLDTHGALFPDETQNHLVHGDYDPANILVDRRDGEWQISGVLDWEFAFSASPLQDMANMLRYAHHMPPLYEAAFLSGVRSGGVELPEDWRLRIDLLNLLSLLDCLVHCPPNQRPNQCADICNLIQNILSRVVPASAGIEWAKDYLLANGYAPSGVPEPIRTMPWSKVTRFATSQGPLFLKEMAPPFSLEPTLVQTLCKWDVDAVPKVIAANGALSCFLMRDAGIPLREHLKDAFQMDLFCKALKIYANIQIKAVNHVDNLLSIGVPDWRVTRLPELYRQLINQEDILQMDGLACAEIKVLQGLQDIVSNLCALLAGHKIPETIEHADFHDNNILIKDGHLTIADWGDAVISHPFFSLASCLNSAGRNHGVQETEVRYEALQSTYLDNWLDFAPKDQLLEAFQLVRRLRTIQVALNFSRVKRGANLPPSSDFDGYLAAALRDFMKAEG